MSPPTCDCSRLPTGEWVFPNAAPDESSERFMSLFFGLLKEDIVCFAGALLVFLCTLWFLGG